MDDSTKPTEISTKCLIPRFWAGDGAIAMRTCYSALRALHCVDDLNIIQNV